MKGKPAKITQERIDQLKAVGLDFNDARQKRDEAQWQSKLELLRQYRERNGHCRVPASYEMDGVKLGSWLSHQRVAYKKHSEGKPAKITQERIDQLEAVGVDWDRAGSHVAVKVGATAKLSRATWSLQRAKNV